MKAKRTPAAWIIVNYVFGVLFVPLGYFIARLLSSRCQGHQWWQTVLDDISGKSLKSVTLDIERWASLNRGPVNQSAT